MPTITAPSGATIVINPAPWIDAKKLKQAIMRRVDQAGIPEPVDGKFQARDILDYIFKLDSDSDVDTALWPCLARCTYNGEKIRHETFDSSAARIDYYTIVEACIKENLSPLVDGLLSELSKLKGSSPKSSESRE